MNTILGQDTTINVPQLLGSDKLYGSAFGTKALRLIQDVIRSSNASTVFLCFDGAQMMDVTFARECILPLRTLGYPHTVIAVQGPVPDAVIGNLTTTAVVTKQMFLLSEGSTWSLIGRQELLTTHQNKIIELLEERRSLSAAELSQNFQTTAACAHTKLKRLADLHAIYRNTEGEEIRYSLLPLS